MGPLAATYLVFLGCCSNVYFLELMVKEDPGSGNLITFAQFFVVAVEGFIFTMKFGAKKTAIPFREYFKMVMMFFIVSVSNNYALNFNIALPLHMIFRSGSLLANMFLGILLLKKKYTMMKYVSVTMISIGITICTMASAKIDGQQASSEEDSVTEFFWWLVGIGLLIFALLTSARMGIMQEVLYTKYGKHPREALFFMHALPLPAFILLYSDIAYHVGLANQSEPLHWSVLNAVPILANIPRTWMYLLGNVITQSVCINAVFVLTTECSSLVVTLVVTLRKFVSLLFSIWYFQNPFTFSHWVGTALVFGGTLLFSDLRSLTKSKKAKTS